MNKKEYNNIVAFHPGYYIKDTIEYMELTQEEFAIRLGVLPKTISKLVNGKANISTKLAEKLSIMLGTSTDVWINLQAKYNESVAEIEKAKFLDSQIKYIEKIDYSFFVKLGLVCETKDKIIKIKEVLRFLKISDFEIFERDDLLVQFRTTSVTQINNLDKFLTNVWVQTVINMGQEIETKPFNEKCLKENIPNIKKMTMMEDGSFINELKQLLAQCGIALVVIPSLKNSKVYAAVKWINKDKVVLGITNRGQDADKFWFSLFHEIKHIMQKQKNVIIDFERNSLLEEEANKYASEMLIPTKEYEKFKLICSNKYFSEEKIESFAKQLNIHSGIIVGRLQKDGLIEYSKLNKLKCKYIFY